MYTVTVPLVSDTLCRSDRNVLAQQLKQTGVERIFLSIGTYIADAHKRRVCMETLRENCAFFEEQGFCVGVWVWTIQFPEENDFAKITSIYGKVTRGEVCPADPAFRNFAAGYMRNWQDAV